MGEKRAKVLLVDDEVDLLSLWRLRLESGGYEVAVAGSGEEALALFPVFQPHVVLTDLRMPGMDGLVLYQTIRQQHRAVPIIIITAHGSIPEAVEATRQGVFSFLTKPINGSDLLAEVEKALALSGAQAIGEEREGWRQDVVCQSAVMNDLLARTKLVAETDSAVLIRGESGTGKEVLAIALHRASPYRNGPFVPVNSSAVPEKLLEAELFGHLKEPWGGETKSHIGLFQFARDGSIFLDEISEMPLQIQVKLLRVLEDRQIRPVGSDQPVPINVRVISSTSQDLDALVRDKKFREDLLYRLNVVTLELPPLRERREDIPLLAEHFLAQLADEEEGREKRFTREAMQALVQAPWPGNVRQLCNVVENAVILSSTAPLISEDLIHDALKQQQSRILPLAEARRQFEQQYLIQLLQTTQGNVSLAARLAQRNRTDFYKLLNRHHIVPAQYKEKEE